MCMCMNTSSSSFRQRTSTSHRAGMCSTHHSSQYDIILVIFMASQSMSQYAIMISIESYILGSLCWCPLLSPADPELCHCHQPSMPLKTEGPACTGKSSWCMGIVATFPGLPTVQFLTKYSDQNRVGRPGNKARWVVGHLSLLIL